MKRTGFLLLMFAALSAISCLKEEVPQTPDSGNFFTFSALREDLKVPTKTALVENNKVVWVNNDKIGVFNAVTGPDGGNVTAGDTDGATFKQEVAEGKWIKPWAFQAQNGGAKAVFKSLYENFDNTKESYLLVYPYSWNYFGHNADAGVDKVRFWVSDSQKATPGTFDPSQAFAVAKTNPLVATNDNPVVFKNVMTLLKFTVPANLDGKITEIAVWGKNNEHLGGEVLCDYSGDEPVAMPFKAAYAESNKGKTAVHLRDANGMAAGTYYMSVCPGEMSGFVVKVTTKSGTVFRREKNAGFTFEGGVIYDMGAIEGENYGRKGITSLPYVFSLTNAAKEGNTAKYLTKINGGVHYPEKKIAEGSLEDGNNGVVFSYRSAARTTADIKTWDSYWNEDRGAYNVPASSLISEEYAAGYDANFKLKVPLNMTMPKSFAVTFGLNTESGAFVNWKLQYSNDNNTWYDGGQFAAYGADAYCRYTINVTSQIEFGDMLYLKWIPVGTAIQNNVDPWDKRRARFWGGVVITGMTPENTPEPAGAVFFEAFDDMVGGVDYLSGGISEGTYRLGLLADCPGQRIGSGSNIKAPEAKPETWNGMTCLHVAMRPGYAQIGHGKAHQNPYWGSYDNFLGKLTTPKLAAGDLTLSFKAMMYRNPLIGMTKADSPDKVTTDKIVVNVIGGGTFEDGTTSKTISGVSYSAFGTYTYAIKGATADTQIEFTSPTDVPSTRWFLDEICVK